MRLVKIFGALVAVCAFSAMAVAGVSAHEFTASVVPTLLLSKATGTQVFTTLAGTLECSTLTGHGIAQAKVSETQKATVSYTGCFAITKSFSVKPTEPINAEYEFNANGTVKLLKAITIVASLGIKCTITFLPDPYASIKYDPVDAKTVLVLEVIIGILSSATGAGCTETYTSSKAGTYVGNSITKADGTGEIGWK
jgi:hypothetical protein